MKFKLYQFIIIIIAFLPSGMKAMYISSSDNSDLKKVKDRVISTLLDRKIMEDHINHLMRSIQKDGSWATINYNDVSRTGFENERHLKNIQDLSVAYRKTSSPFYKNADLKTVIYSAINFWLQHDFISDNWYHNEISGPRAWANILLLVGASLTEKETNNILNLAGRANLNAWGARPTADRMRIASIMARIALYKNSKRELKKVVVAMGKTVKIWLNRGIQPDLSFQHRNDHVISTLAYGTAYVEALGEWAARFAGTKFRFSDEAMHKIVDYFLDGICKTMVYGKYPDPGALNRGMSRPGELYPREAGVPKKLLSATSYRQKELKKIINIRENRLQSNRTFDKFFWRSEYHSHQSRGWFMSVRMYSDRNNSMEYPYNGESIKQHHYADGANFISRTGTEYFNIFPVLDWMKIPGTTIIQKPSLPGPKKIPQRGLTDFVGGVSDGTYGAAAFDFKSPLDSLKAKKGWFMFDKAYVCLGAGISSDQKYPAVTTINQSLLKTDVKVHDHNKDRYINLKKGIHIVKNADWVLQDSIGYLFPSPKTVHISNTEAKGSWYSINHQSHSSKEEIHKNIFELWLNHGRKPQDAKYQYIVVPGISSNDLADYQKKSDIEILANTTKIQAVKNKRLNLSQILFYKAGKINLQKEITISMTSPGLVMIKTKGQKIKKITVADPTRKRSKMHLKVTTRFKGATSNWKAIPNEDANYSDIYVGLPDGEKAGKSVIMRNGQTVDTDNAYKIGAVKQNQSVHIDSTKGRHYITEKYGGGLVFYIDHTGKHGLIVAENDQSDGIRWGNGISQKTFTPVNNGSTVTNATGNGIGAGGRNTTLIIARQTLYNPNGKFAAKVCANSQTKNYGDWYLPSKEELNLMYKQRKNIVGLRKGLYWSSTEYNAGFVWGQNFRGYGGQQTINKGSQSHVRCIRKF